jgi:hypothetical protein
MMVVPTTMISWTFRPCRLLSVLVDPTLLVVVVRIGRPKLPIHLALQPTEVFLIRGQLRTKHRQACLGLPGYQRNAGGTQVNSDGLAAHGVFGFVRGHAFERQLHAVAIPLAVSPLRLWTAGLALKQASIFDPVIQAMFHHWIVPVDESRQVIVLPDQQPLVPLLWFLEHKAQTGIVALVLEAGEAAPSALEAHAARLAQAHPIEGLIGAAGKPLGQHRVQVLSQPADAQVFRDGMEGILGKAVLVAQGSKGSGSLLFVGAGNGTRSPAWAGSARMRRKRLSPTESTAL